jgi:hypothetical protein
MSFPNKSSVRCGLIGVFILILLGAIFGSLTSATLVLTGTVFSPAPPIVPGSGQYAISSATIIPSGATTFSRTHMLQMQTGLDDAKWNIQIIVNGIPAAQQSASGATAFINGYLLSYPTTSDVSITIAINGTVPANASGNVTILNLIELDSTASPVPGSGFTVISPRITTLVTPSVTDNTAISATTPHGSIPLPTQSSSLLPFTAPVALLVMSAGYKRMWSRR